MITQDNVPPGKRGRLLPGDRPEPRDRRGGGFLLATSQISQTTLRSVLGKADLDTLLAERERLNEDLQKIIEQTEPWGVKVTTVEIKDVEIEQMQRAMARQAEAERERRCRSSTPRASSRPRRSSPRPPRSSARTRRPSAHLQTLLEMGVNQNTTIIFPLPIDLIEAFADIRARATRLAADDGADCRLTLTVRPTRDAAEVEAAMDLRVRVFCDEQGVSQEEELDGLDEGAQILALDESGVIAACRLRDLGAEWKLRRMAVEARVRGLGVGARLLAGAEEEAQAAGAQTMVLHAQRRAEPFYSANGYAPEGEAFMDAGIPSIAMREGADGKATRAPAPEVTSTKLTGLRTILAGARRPSPSTSVG